VEKRSGNVGVSTKWNVNKTKGCEVDLHIVSTGLNILERMEGIMSQM
jgi:hypothetical protein